MYSPPHSFVDTSLEKSAHVFPIISTDPSSIQQQKLLNTPKRPDAEGLVPSLWHSWKVAIFRGQAY